MEQDLPLYKTRKINGCCNYSYFSQPIFAVTGSLGGIGIVINSIQGETLDIIICSIMSLGSVLAWFRVRKLGEAQSVMDSVQVLETQNQELQNSTSILQEENENLKESNDQLNALEIKLTNDLGDLRNVLGIVDIQNKTAQEIQNELIQTAEKLKIQNTKYEKLNKINAFFVSDENHDGKLTENELDTLHTIGLNSDENVTDYDSNSDGQITKEEYLNKPKL